MTRTNQILVAAVVVQVGLIALVWSSGSERSLAKLEPIVEVKADSVNKIEVYDRLEPGDKAPAKPAVVVSRTPKGWVLSSHHDYPVKESAVDALLTKLEGLKSRGPVTTQASRHRQLRVAADRYERKLVIHAGGEPLVLYLGSAAGRGKTALRVEGRDEIHGAPGLTSYSVGAAPRSWVETEYFKKGPDAITRLTVTNKQGTFDLKRADGEAPWKRFEGEVEVPVPANKELDSGAVDALAGIVNRLTLWEPADPAKKGFAPAATLAFVAGDATHTLKIGELKDDRYLAAIDDRSPVWINKANLEPVVSFGPDKLYRDPPKPGDEARPDEVPQLPPGLGAP